MINYTSKTGFTLVELSIVLVIIGLVVGGVLVGQDLIRAAELKTYTSDIDKYRTALNVFKGKYGYYPGDMPNATTIWGAQDPTPGTCQITASTGQLTCNGNGDGGLGNTGLTYYERHRAWQQLANAGLVAGVYSGIRAGLDPVYVVPGVNAPYTLDKKGGFSLSTIGQKTGDSEWFDGYYDNIAIILGAVGDRWEAAYPLLTASEAYNIDKKFDDGLPATGYVVSFKAGGHFVPNCTTTATATSSTYNLTYVGAACSVAFLK